MSFWSQDTDKLRQLILYVASRSADKNQGDIYLNKVLFFSDAWALQHIGAPITGSRYQKLPFGPASRPLMPLRAEMERNGEVETEMVGTSRVTTALREPDLTLFSVEEVKLVDEVMELFEGVSANVLSDVSHSIAPGWNMVELKEDIPLETQLISTAPVPEAALERGRELAAEFGW